MKSTVQNSIFRNWIRKKWIFVRLQIHFFIFQPYMRDPCKPLRNFFRLFSLTRFSIFILSCAHFINVSGATWSSLAASLIVHSPLIYRSYALPNPSGVIPFVISFSSLNSDSSLASKNTNINKKQLSCFPKPRQPFLNYSRLFFQAGLSFQSFLTAAVPHTSGCSVSAHSRSQISSITCRDRNLREDWIMPYMV